MVYYEPDPWSQVALAFVAAGVIANTLLLRLLLGGKTPEWLFPVRGRWLRYLLGAVVAFAWLLLLLGPAFLP